MEGQPSSNQLARLTLATAFPCLAVVHRSDAATWLT